MIDTPDPEVADAAREAIGEGPQGSSPSPSAEAPKKRIGRPKGSIPWNKGKKLGQRGDAKPSRSSSEPVEPDEEEIAAGTLISSTVWGLLAPRIGLAPLSDGEASKLGEAVACVVKKYVPSYGEWEPEINLALVLGFLILGKYQGKEPSPDKPVEAPFKVEPGPPGAKPFDGTVDPKFGERFGGR